MVAGSVRGPAHVRSGERCQDAWLAIPDSDASLAVVCDGMGSRSRAREGATAATLATRDAWRWWRCSPVGSVADLIRLIEVRWRLRLGAIPPDAASTTCLFYAEDGHGRASVGQLGDGMIARRDATGDVVIHRRLASEFGATSALGVRHTLADWSYRLATPLRPGESVLMATDGVAEDLRPERIGDLMRWVIDELGAQEHGNRQLRSELRSWPVPHHRDDKTLLVMWRPCKSPNE
ncbi:MAG: protein phosphatase 2C domain-containing protein [Myxococcales bacterium]|nr:protein phosphatase 2C domain-containing protein [Myxococcales bacterium]